MIKEAIGKLVDGRDLSHLEAYEAMREIMSGRATPAQISALLTALRMKGESVGEIAAFSAAMRDFCRRINPKVRGRLVDICGTGGDKVKTFNISTAAAFVAAGAGVTVAKHGNRSITSKSGSADVLEQLGLNLSTPIEIVERSIENIGIGFMFAPLFHPAMRHAAAPRREIGIRTVFNILGPLANPASPDAQVVGVYDPGLVEKVAHVLHNLGLREAIVVHGLDGIDEISIVGKTMMAWLRGGEIQTFEVVPEDLGTRRVCVENISPEMGPGESAEVIFKILYGCIKAGDPKRDLVAVNAAAGIIVGGMADDFSYGVELAQESIESGAAYRKLKELIKFCDGSDVSKLEELEAKNG